MSAYEELHKNVLRLVGDAQPLSALPITEILCELRPACAETQTLRARVLFEVREFENALRIVRALVEARTASTTALMYGMKATFELGEIKQCANYCEQLLTACRNNSPALCYLAKCAECSGETDKAVHYYKKALEEDAFCGEAVSALIDRKLLGGRQLHTVVDSLNLTQDAEPLRRSYHARIQTKFGDSGDDADVSAEGVPKRLILLGAARRHYEHNNLRQALSITTELLELDPLDRDVVCQHLCVLVDLKATPKIFEAAHFLSKSNSRAELAVYAIGCYYYSLANYERAGRYFCRGTELDCYFAEAWVAYAHCYAKLEEGEHALSVYRRAMNLFPGLSSCSTYVGMQHGRVHQWPIAMCFFEESLLKSPQDALVLNEIAVTYVRYEQYEEALQFLRLAFKALPNNTNPNEHRDCIIFNLATVLRKSGELDEALHYYNLYVACRPNAGHAHCALGFTYHLMGNLKAAIAHYHTALSIKPDSFCTEMLDRALASDFGQNVGGIKWGPDGDAESPAPNDVSFSTASRPLRSESHRQDGSNTGSPQQNVGRSLMF